MTTVQGQSDEQAVSALLAEKMAQFCHLLRARGFKIGVGETLDACRVADRLLASNFPAFRSGLRSLLTASEAEWRLFGPCFDAFWTTGDGPPPALPSDDPPLPVEEAGAEAAWQVAGYKETARAAEEEGTRTTGAGSAEALRLTDLSHLSGEDLRQLERLAQRLWRRMSLRLARRLRGRQLARRIDLRRTLRRNISRGGEPLELVHAGRKLRRPGLVVLLDVSGSMNQYSFFFLRFVYALQQHFRRVASFLFSTHLVEVSDLLHTRNLPAVLEEMSGMTLGWGGGTEIGESLRSLNREHGAAVFRGRPRLIVLSDGWDVGETALLHEQLRDLRRKVSRIIWLNPLLGMEGYQPLTRGMQTALPWLDVFAPAHNLESLLDIERHLAG